MLLCSEPKLLIQGEDKKNLVHVSGECEEQRNINTPFEVDRRYMNYFCSDPSHWKFNDIVISRVWCENL